jgi:lysophospholipase L1-like esterase
MLLHRLGHKYMLRTSIAMRSSQFAQLPPPTGRVVFLGDSITEGGLWQEWFPSLDCVNRGIGGDTIDHLRTRLDSAIDAPAAVFLLIVTNDLGLDRSVDRVAADLGSLVGEIRDRAPKVPLFIQSVMPRQGRFATRILELNVRYREIAEWAGAVYIDLWPALADENHCLRAEFTRDRLHLTGAGYAAWVELLRPHMRTLRR